MCCSVLYDRKTRKPGDRKDTLLIKSETRTKLMQPTQKAARLISDVRLHTEDSSMKKIKKESNKQRPQSKFDKRINRLGFWFSFVFIVILWVTVISYIKSGNYFGHSNYMGLPVGTFLLLPVLIVATGVFIYAVWKHFHGVEVMNRIGKNPKWMNKPPYKWPWQ